jgi:hypothetical protein
MPLSEKLMVIVLTKRLSGVLSKLAPAFSPTQPKDVFGPPPSKGAPNTLEEMDAGVLAEARRHACV